MSVEMKEWLDQNLTLSASLAILTSIEFGPIPWSLLFVGEQTRMSRSTGHGSCLLLDINFLFMSNFVHCDPLFDIPTRIESRL
jgi:hypothetical protein